MLRQITPVLLTYNEEANLPRVLARLDWAGDIVIVDSFSTDRTETIARSHPRVRFYQRAFDTHARQWNFAIQETAIATEWILALDADYVLSDGLIGELEQLVPEGDVNGYSVQFRYCVAGRPLRGSLYPPVTVLYRRGTASYKQDGHTQRLELAGKVGHLRSIIYHDDRKSLAHWYAAQQRYADLEVEHLLSRAPSLPSFGDRIRLRGWAAPLLVGIYAGIFKGCLLDGRRGLFYVFQRVLVELLIALAIMDRKLRDADAGTSRDEQRDRA